MNSGVFWRAVTAFRAANTEESRHQARVTLLQLAVGDDTLVGQRAAEALRAEGLVVIRDRPVHQAAG